MIEFTGVASVRDGRIRVPAFHGYYYQTCCACCPGHDWLFVWGAN